MMFRDLILQKTNSRNEHVHNNKNKRQNRKKKKKSENLKLNGFHGDGGIDKKNTNHINGSVPFLVLRLIIQPTNHVPNLGPKISMGLSMTMLFFSHDQM